MIQYVTRLAAFAAAVVLDRRQPKSVRETASVPDLRMPSVRELSARRPEPRRRAPATPRAARPARVRKRPREWEFGTGPGANGPVVTAHTKSEARGIIKRRWALRSTRYVRCGLAGSLDLAGKPLSAFVRTVNAAIREGRSFRAAAGAAAWAVA